MALTRKMLKAMGIEEEKIDQIIEAHAETVDGLKADLNRYKGDAEKLPGVQKELDELKAAGDGGYKEKYEKEHTAFEDFKKAQKGKETKEAKEKAYRALLKEAGVSEKRIESVLRVTDLESISLEEDGKIKDADKVKDSVKTEWADFIVQTQTSGAPTSTPPKTSGAGKTKDEILAIKDGAQRRQAMMENPQLFGLTPAQP